MANALPILLEDVTKAILDAFILGKSFKTMLFSAAIDGTGATNISDLTEIAAGHGYSAGGYGTTIASAQDGSAAYLVASQPTIAASGGDIVYRSIAIYDVASGDLLAAYDEAGTTTVINGLSRVIEFDQTVGVLRAI